MTALIFLTHYLRMFCWRRLCADLCVIFGLHGNVANVYNTL